MTKVLIPGSYDPITNGHLYLIRTCASLFDEVHVIAFINAEKKSAFTKQSRVKMLQIACADFKNVITGSDDGYVVDYAERNNIPVLVRGVRSTQDLEYEMHMASNNSILKPGITTFFLPANANNASISSSEVRRRVCDGKDISDIVPHDIVPIITDELSKAKKES